MNRIARFILVVAGGLALFLGWPRAALADLSGDIQQVLSDKLLDHAQAGIDIVRLGSSAQSVIYQHNQTTPLIPASNLKVVTTSAALAELGPDFKFRTLLFAHGHDLVIIGDGDPTLGDAELLKKSGWDVTTGFAEWGAALQKRGMSFTDLRVDDSVFDEEFLHPDWPADQVQKRYMAEVAGLNLNANCIDVYVHPHSAGSVVDFITDPATSYVTIKNTCLGGIDNAVWLSRVAGSNQLILQGHARETNSVPVSVTIHDPPLYAATVLRETFASAGVKITGQVVRDRTCRTAYAKDPSGWTLLAVHETDLPSVIDRANKDSMNLYAECLCKRLGFASAGEGTWQNGTAAVGKFLRSLDIGSTEYSLSDGCGLSKHDSVSAHLMTTVLTHDFYGPNSKTWLASLSIAGEDGTLTNRFRGTDLRGRVIAKSGFVDSVSSLSGYLHAKDDRWYSFSILFNGIPMKSNSSAKALEERIVEALDHYASGNAAQAGAN